MAVGLHPFVGPRFVSDTSIHSPWYALLVLSFQFSSALRAWRGWFLSRGGESPGCGPSFSAVDLLLHVVSPFTGGLFTEVKQAAMVLAYESVILERLDFGVAIAEARLCLDQSALAPSLGLPGSSPSHW